MQVHSPVTELGKRIEGVTQPIRIARSKPQFPDRPAVGAFQRQINVGDDPRAIGTVADSLTLDLFAACGSALVNQ